MNFCVQYRLCFNWLKEIHKKVKCAISNSALFFFSVLCCGAGAMTHDMLSYSISWVLYSLGDEVRHLLGNATLE